MTPTSVWILGDQLLVDHPALTAAEQTAGRRNARLPYQRKKLVLLFSAMRHYAEELRQQGWQVDHLKAETTAEGLLRHVSRHRPGLLLTMAASEARGRRWQTARLSDILGLPVEAGRGVLWGKSTGPARYRSITNCTSCCAVG